MYRDGELRLFGRAPQRLPVGSQIRQAQEHANELREIGVHHVNLAGCHAVIEKSARAGSTYAMSEPVIIARRLEFGKGKHARCNPMMNAFVLRPF